MDISTSEVAGDCIMTLIPSVQSKNLQIQEKVVTTAQEGPISDRNTDQQNVHTTSTNLKRRRVSRACDVCRKGKIKCDGKQPCTHCAVSSLGLSPSASPASPPSPTLHPFFFVN